MLLPALWTLAAIAFVSAQICAVWSGAVYSGLMVRVNQQLRVEQRFRWWEAKSARHWAEAKRRYPREARHAYLVGAVAFACFAVAIASLSCASWLQFHP